MEIQGKHGIILKLLVKHINDFLSDSVDEYLIRNFYFMTEVTPNPIFWGNTPLKQMMKPLDEMTKFELSSMNHDCSLARGTLCHLHCISSKN